MRDKEHKKLRVRYQLELVSVVCKMKVPAIRKAMQRLGLGTGVKDFAEFIKLSDGRHAD